MDYINNRKYKNHQNSDEFDALQKYIFSFYKTKIQTKVSDVTFVKYHRSHISVIGRKYVAVA